MMIPLITGEEWQTRVMKADQRPPIAARLQGTPAERGKVRVNIKERLTATCAETQTRSILCG